VNKILILSLILLGNKKFYKLDFQARNVSATVNEIRILKMGQAMKIAA